MRLSFVFLAMSCISVTYAANFYTIIGPDGRPMVVQKPNESEKKTSIQVQPQVEKKLSAQIQIQSVTPIVPPKPIVAQSEKQKNVELPLTNTVKNVDADEQPDDSTINSRLDNGYTAKILEVERDAKAKQKHAEAKHKNAESIVLPNSSVTQMNTQPQILTEKKVEIVQDNKTNVAPKGDVNITEIDGVQYVNNEYLEDREFNLEGKKRFYVMPETGAMAGGRFETVERQKGLSQSLLDKIRQRKPTEHKAIALSTTYYRLPKDEVIQTLEQSCFSGKKIDKAKTISLKNQEVSFFPVAPIKENFAYEVVKLDSNIENILFSSYASSKKKPSYYWPLVVFLDEKGCVVEGVSGFKNDEQGESATQYASLEGILKKPNSAHYLFMTPLSEAIDIQDRELTNQGQIKLSVIQ